MGNGEAKELICMTHGHELRGRGNAGGREGAEQRGMNGRKKRDNCNSIINKIDTEKFLVELSKSHAILGLLFLVNISNIP